MAILNFKKRFAPKVKSGKKRQTIRAFRKYPIKVDERLYLYTGLRTKSTQKLREVTCISVEHIEIRFYARRLPVVIISNCAIWEPNGLNEFAKADGFQDWLDFQNFWFQEHGPLKVFKGTLIKW
jgi:hypothetical protein